MSFLSQYKNRFEEYLSAVLNEYSDLPESLLQTIRYGIVDAGKRIRPILVMLGAEIASGSADKVYRLAVGVECIHCYSLVHDDLPSMDNDDLRRGKPTVHVRFGEGAAVLAGDGLLNMAYEIMLGEPNVTPDYVRAMRIIAEHSGIRGMILGQHIDLSTNDKTQDQIEACNRYKTGALIKAALLSGATAFGAGEKLISDLQNYADDLGQIFQIVDDILDVVSTDAVLGKRVGSDNAANKRNYVTVRGVAAAREQVERLSAHARQCVQGYGEAGKKLCELVTAMVIRTK